MHGSILRDVLRTRLADIVAGIFEVGTVFTALYKLTSSSLFDSSHESRRSVGSGLIDDVCSNELGN